MLLLLLFIGQNAWCQSETTLTELESGSLSSTVQWTLYYKGDDEWDLHLSITGTGDMPNYTLAGSRPWGSYRQEISSIFIADGITAIGTYAFAYTGISEVCIPSSVTSIGTGAFDNCSSLSLIHYDGRCTANTGISFSGVAATGKLIEATASSTHHGFVTDYAQTPSGWKHYTHGGKCQGGAWVAENGTELFFYGLKPGAIVNAAIPANERDVIGAMVDVAEYHPWRTNCYNYTSLEINKNVSGIGENEFLGYENSDVSKMGYTNMQTITVESGNQYFVVGDDGALYDKNKTTVYLYPAKNTTKNIEIPSTVKNIRSGAFYGASNITNITFRGTINTIGEYSFAQARLLSYIYFATKKAPTSTAASAFLGVALYGRVIAEAETNAFKAFTEGIGSGWTFSGGITYYISYGGGLYIQGYGAYDIRSEDAEWYSKRDEITSIVVGDGITDIGWSAFENCSNVTNVTLKNKGTIGVSAFKNCTSLTRVNINTGVTKIEGKELNDIFKPFYGCSQLTTINITNFASFYAIGNLEYLTDSRYGTAAEKTLYVNGTPFSSTSMLEIPEGVTSVYADAFKYFKNVTMIKIPSSVKEIRAADFSRCKYLTEITVPSTVNNIGDLAFHDCTGLRIVTLNNKGDIGEGAFEGCTSLQIVSLNNIGSIIGNGVFYKCSSLTRVNVGAGFKGFEDITTSSYYTYDKYYPFEGCSKLKNINIVDFASFNAIKNLNYLTSSNCGTAEEKTLFINGTVHDAKNIFYIPEGITYNVHALRFFSNVKKVCFPSTTTKISNLYFQYATDIILPVSVTSVAEGAFYNCPALERIVCLCPERAPSTTGSVAVNPSKITLRVPYTSSATFAASEVWREFKIEEGPLSYKTCYMKTLEERDLNAFLSEKVVYTYSSNTDGVTVENGVVSSGNYKYDGSRTSPEGGAAIIVVSENANSYYITVFVEPREVELTDGKAYNLVEDFEAEKISYTRSFSQAGKWQAIYLPFAFDVEKYRNDFDIAEIFTICPTSDTNGDGQLDANDDKKLIISVLKSGETQPNAPYMIRPKAATTYTIVSENTTLASAEINEVEFGTSRTQYSVKGIYDADFYAVPGDNNIYITASGGFGVAKNKNVNVKPNRWILHEEAKNYVGSSTSSSNVKDADITIEVLGEDIDETTAIRLINGETISAEGKNNTMYNLNGMKVDSSKSLPSGIYIINGKKVFKK